MAPVLEIMGLDKSFGKKKILDNVTLAVEPGEVFGFLGPNGAGKTTAIKVVMGFLSPDAGEIRINGFDTRRQYEAAMAGVGGIVENPEMYKDLSGYQNLRLYARLHQGVTKERINEMVRLVGLENRIHDKVKKYSLGMKQRCGLAQALLHRPRLLVLDEPTNGLDPKGIKELRDILLRLAHEEGVGVFVSSHLLGEMEQMCDRVAIIVNGKIRGITPVSELHQLSGSGYVLKVSNPAAATDAINAAFGNVALTSGSDCLLQLDEKQLPAVMQLLMEKGITLHSVGRQERSLEDAFMELTGGEGIG